MSTSGPVPQSERQVLLDVLRGFALLGILMMNIQLFAMPFAAYSNPTAYGSLDGLNYGVWFVSHVFFDQKFMTIFAMLFGAGIVLMAERAGTRGDRPAPRHYRRMLWLLVFGLVHAYGLWAGDILVLYAVCGLWVFLFRDRSPRTLLIAGTVIIGVGSALFLLFYVGMQQVSPDELAALEREMWRPPSQAIAHEIANYRSGWWGQMPLRVAQSMEFHLKITWVWGLWRAGGLMLIGMALYKLGVLTGHRPSCWYASLMAGGALAGLPLIVVGTLQIEARGWDFPWTFFVGSQWNYWGSLLLSLGYVGLVMLLVQQGVLRGLTVALSAVGRMAFTNYLLQTLLCTAIFYGHGLGLHGSVSRTSQALVVLAVWALQLAISPRWLRHFEFGPFEWLWRTLTYGHAPPFRRAVAVTGG